MQENTGAEAGYPGDSDVTDEFGLAGVPDALRDPGAHLHVYGKRRVFERRKMGHVTVVSTDADDALERARRARAALRWED